MKKVAQQKKPDKPIKLDAVLDALGCGADKAGDTYPAWLAFAGAAKGVAESERTTLTRDELVTARRSLWEAIQAVDRVLAENQRARMRVLG